MTQNTHGPLVVWAVEPDSVQTQLNTIVALNAAGVDAVLLPGVSPASVDPILVAGAASRRAPGIGLVPSFSPWLQPPFHTARALGTLDALTSGRAGWFVQAGAATFASTDDTPRWNASRVTDPAEVDSALGDYLDATLALWNSWEPDALIADVEAGQYVDPSKVHTTDYHGDFFDVRGPLNMPRPPQGRPPIFARFAAGAAAASRADVVVVGAEDEVAAARAVAPVVLLELAGEQAAQLPLAGPTSADGYVISGISSQGDGALFGQVVYSVFPQLARAGGITCPASRPGLLRDRLGLDPTRFAWSPAAPARPSASAASSKAL